MTKLLVVADQSPYHDDAVMGRHSSARYDGAMPCRHWYTVVATRNCKIFKDTYDEQKGKYNEDLHYHLQTERLHISPALGKRHRIPLTVQKRAHVQYIQETDVLRFQKRL